MFRYILQHWSLLWTSSLLLVVGICQEIHDGMDILQPYIHHHGPVHRRHRDTQHCQPIKYVNVTHSFYPAFKNRSANLPPFQSYQLTKQAGPYWAIKYLYVLHQVVTNPLSTLSIQEPGYRGSCLNESGTRVTVRETARLNNCLFASNAGYFNTHNGHCLGNVVSEGKFVHNSGGIQNVHFGITADGKIFTGYLSELDYLATGFKELVGGVIWLVRDGEKFVEESMKMECPDTEETGTLNRFVNVISARTAIGHDALGRVHVVQVNGLTDKVGINLYDFADLLINLGIINAINLDGGGSATSIINGTLVNFPSDKCPDKINNCERAVSTIICVRYPSCTVADCSNHGVCHKGRCLCREPWIGDGCDILDTRRCGSHGTWINDGCHCHPGWHGLNCSLSCSSGWYGSNCTGQCLCGNHGDCDVLTGDCHCHVGYTGKFCQKKCPYGYYGQNCLNICFCENSCFCDHVTGSCNDTNVSPDYIRAGDCLVRLAIEKDSLVPDRHEQYSLCVSSVACLCVIAAASLILNAVFTFLLVKYRRDNPVVNGAEAMELSSSLSSKSFTQENKKKFRRRRRRPRAEQPKNFQYRALNGGVNSRVDNPGVSSSRTSSVYFGWLNEEEDGEKGGGGSVKGIEEEEGTLTGSGEEENDLFLARKKGRL